MSIRNQKAGGRSIQFPTRLRAFPLYRILIPSLTQICYLNTAMEFPVKAVGQVFHPFSLARSDT
jgi:hypothetical protein